MTNDFIQYLKESSDCLYIYDRNFSIYGLPEKERYTIIVHNGWVCPEDWIGYDPTVYQIYDIVSWFDMVLNGEIVCWECACLNKKYVIKEYVKLIMTTNPLQLRKEIDKEISLYRGLSNISDWQIICHLKFANQIIENHKIVNFKEAASDYQLILSDKYKDAFKEPYDYLKKLTDGMLKNEQLKNIKKHE